ncbi:uncharacterized protein LODBEIA_P14520 [Lodderomyces beijingensis]|uniref:J domain-containing protein n=1 Tax=Lodderomyces beijingensis TaxID=1775926 RepID=A0ABP0ZGE7_9ASCO
MRLLYVVLFLFGVCLAWDKDDYEIFKLNDQIQQVLGAETTFYSWLGLEQGPSSTRDEIKRAYRQLSRKLHPDKASSAPRKAQKQAEEVFAMLSLVGDILSDQSKKKRYDYFHAKGFPKWKGTGYYYSKFRPGLVFTMVLLYVLVGVFHYFALRINRLQNFKRIANIRSDVKSQAWGGSQVPPADGSDRRLTNEMNGKVFLVKNTGEVYIEDGEELHLVDEHEINVNPVFKDTLFFKLPAKLYNATLGRYLKPIDTLVQFAKREEAKEVAEPAKVVKKKQPKGKKMELANGKVVYSRKK